MRCSRSCSSSIGHTWQDRGLKGVRKAQVKLGAYYLVTGAEEKARRIHADMAGEPAERIRAIRSELERVETKDFWEIIDRAAISNTCRPSKGGDGAVFRLVRSASPRRRVKGEAAL